MSFFNEPFVWFALAYLVWVMFWIDRRCSCRSKLRLSKSDQKCPHCDTWQSDCGGWRWVGNSENHEIDFVAECRNCGMYSDWVWIGPGVCATYEEINKPKRKSTSLSVNQHHQGMSDA